MYSPLGPLSPRRWWWGRELARLLGVGRREERLLEWWDWLLVTFTCCGIRGKREGGRERERNMGEGERLINLWSNGITTQSRILSGDN